MNELTGLTDMHLQEEGHNIDLANLEEKEGMQLQQLYELMSLLSELKYTGATK